MLICQANPLHEDTHSGMQQTIKMARDKYLWPGMGQDIKKFVKSCPVCQQALACQAWQFPEREDRIDDR